MNTRLILTTAAGAFLWLPSAYAGSRSGGTGTATVTIPADTLSSGGGRSTAGSGTGAVVITASMGGIIGTATATSAIRVQQGYIPQILSFALTGYDLWASQNIPAGKDATLNGDWNGDGIPNGIAYVFGNTPVTTSGKGRITAPPSIPGDVDVYLDYSVSLVNWEDPGIVRWVNGAPPEFIDSNVSIVGTEVVDTYVTPFGKAFYRYRVVRR